MSKTTIEWSDHNWNPFFGCRRKSSGCLNCYAEQIAARFSGKDKTGRLLPFHGIAGRVGGKARWTGMTRLSEETLFAPIKRKTPTTYFVNSMSDTFYSAFPDEWIHRLFAVAAIADRHTFQFLTKRPERMRDYFNDPETRFEIADAVAQTHNELENEDIGRAAMETFELIKKGVLAKTEAGSFYLQSFPLPNVWLGTSVENRETLHRIEWLRKTPARVRWLSIEPLLEDLGEIDLTGIHWVVIGGESGPGARKCEINWIRKIVAQSESAGIPCFIKQLGRNVELNGAPYAKKGTKGNVFEEFPQDLQIRQYS